MFVWWPLVSLRGHRAMVGLATKEGEAVAGYCEGSHGKREVHQGHRRSHLGTGHREQTLRADEALGLVQWRLFLT